MAEDLKNLIIYPLPAAHITANKRLWASLQPRNFQDIF
jgi:hypothetical protein